MDLQERIITEAGILFSRYGIRSITMDALAEEMGISKRTIYENFKDKNSLLLEVISYFKIKQLKEFNEILEESDNVIDALFTVLKMMINSMKQLNPVFFHDMKRYHANIHKQLQEEGDIRDYSFTRRILKEGINQDIFRAELNMEIVNFALHELFNMFSPDNRITTQGYDRAELFNNIILPYLRGISTEKGIKLIDAKEELKNY